MNQLSFDRRVEILGCLVEGMSIRATERHCRVHRDTVMKLGLEVGEVCHQLNDQMMRDLRVTFIQMDEIWSFIKKKQKHLRIDDPAECGDAWTHIVFSKRERAIISYVTGKRGTETMKLLIADARSRILGEPHISTDGHDPYRQVIADVFGLDCTFGQVVKNYQGSKYVSSDKRPVIGNTNPDLISTSLIERSNLTLRQQQKRFARKTLAHSKKLRNHEAAVALHVAFYNFVRVHSTLRVTPAMELGVTDHVWSLGELMERAEAAASEGAGEQVAQVSGMEVLDPNTMFEPWPPASGGSGRPKLTVIPGGKR
jgi:IS1 family transposase